MVQKMMLLGLSIFFVLVVAMLLIPKGPALSSYDYLKKPQTRVLHDQKMIVVEARGDPEEVSAKAFKMLFATYFKIPGAQKGPRQPAPRARWTEQADTVKSQWIGLYALPIPQQTEQLPEIRHEDGLTVNIATWSYGRVAEILHIGSYTEESASIEKLKNFIQRQGDSIIGDHEEEYIKGPTLYSKGDPKKYYTIIRYRVCKTQTMQ